MKIFNVFAIITFGFFLVTGISGTALAADIVCGDCHSAPPVTADACPGEDANGLHGVHVNYSSASYPKTVADYGKCAYCHTATTATAPTATHNNSYVNVTGVDSGGLATNLDFHPGTGTCTGACHNNEAASAMWGNFTTSTITLSCNSCHDDASASSMDLSGAHAGHFGSTIDLSGIAGAVALDAGDNTTCANCHTDNTSDGNPVSVDDGTQKAFTHASDGTNVASDNAAISLVAGTDTRGSGAADSCANVCHANKAALWSDTSLDCDSCHYFEVAPTSTNNNAAVVSLSCAHGAHFDAGKVCSDCHGTLPTDNSHASALPVVSANATVVRTGMTYNDGPNTCTNTGTGCHGAGSTTPGWCGVPVYHQCALCHNYPTVSGRDWTAGNGHASRFDGVTNRHLAASGWDADNDTYEAATTNASSCGLCHSGGAHNNGTIDVAGNGHEDCAGDGNFDPVITSSGSNVTCDNVDCHSGKTTPNWW